MCYGCGFKAEVIETIMYGYEFREVDEHIEVYLNGEFQFSADSEKEASAELKNL